MNELHLQLCSSVEWGDHVEQTLLPWVLAGLDLGASALEIGPGPGRTTDLLMSRVASLTALEADADLAAALADRLTATSVTVVNADATAMPFQADRFDSALSFTMLHHVPSRSLQDQLLAEVCRVVRPGGIFTGVDSQDSEAFRQIHEGDVCVPVESGDFRRRLIGAGFVGCQVELSHDRARMRFLGRVPLHA